MIQVNVSEAKSNLSELIRKLEAHEESSIAIARDGIPVVQMRLVDDSPTPRRIGVAKGILPDCGSCEDMNWCNEEISKEFGL